MPKTLGTEYFSSPISPIERQWLQTTGSFAGDSERNNRPSLTGSHAPPKKKIKTGPTVARTEINKPSQGRSATSFHELQYEGGGFYWEVKTPIWYPSEQHCCFWWSHFIAFGAVWPKYWATMSWVPTSIDDGAQSVGDFLLVVCSFFLWRRLAIWRRCICIHKHTIYYSKNYSTWAKYETVKIPCV